LTVVRAGGILAVGRPGRRPRKPDRQAHDKEDDMTLSEQVDALQAQVAEVKSSLEASRHETNEQIRARIADARAKAGAAQGAVHDHTDEAADRVHTQWQSFKADVATMLQELKGRIGRQRDEHDVKEAEIAAERAEDNAVDALGFAVLAVYGFQVEVLDAVDARAWADERAAASPSS
jgi:hypothetical protein